MTEQDAQPREEEETRAEDQAGSGSHSRVLIPISLVLIVLGCLLSAVAALSGLGIGPFPGLLQAVSGVVGFFPRDLMYVLGVMGVCLFIGGLVVIYQALQ